MNENKQILQLKRVYGVSKDCRQKIWFKDENTVVYPCGRTLVFTQLNEMVNNTSFFSTPGKYLVGKNQQFNTLGISCLAFSPIVPSIKSRSFAIAERGEKHIVVSIYEVQPGPPNFEQMCKKKKTLILSREEIGSNEIISMQFSPNGLNLMAQTGGPEYKLIVWNRDPEAKWGDDKGNRYSVTPSSTPQNSPVFQASFSPSASMICVTGSGLFKILKVEEGGVLKPFQPTVSGTGTTQNVNNSISASQAAGNYLAHAWINDSLLVVANDSGEIFIYEKGLFKTILSTSPSNGLKINSIVPYMNGFICAGEKGQISVFDASDEKEYFKNTKNFKLNCELHAQDSEFVVAGEEDDQDHGMTSPKGSSFIQDDQNNIVDLSLSTNNQSLALVTSTGQQFSLSLSGLEVIKDEDVKFEQLSTPFHSKKITGVDISISKPLIATCSLDRTVEIVNYMEPQEKIIRKSFSSEAHALAFHPTGLYLVVGFSDCVRFLTVRGKEIFELKTFQISNCQIVKFSNGGNLFAVVYGKNRITVFNTYTLQSEPIATSHTGKITSLCWDKTDSFLTTVGDDSCIFTHTLRTGKKIYETQSIKDCIFTGVANRDSVSEAAHSVLVTGHGLNIGSALFEIQDGQKNRSEVLEELPTCLCYGNNSKILYCGMENGSVHVFSFLSNFMLKQNFTAHSSAVSRICLSRPDEGLLVSVGEDGTMCLFDIKDLDGNHPVSPIKFSDDILISTAELEEKNEFIQELKAKVTEMKSESDYEQRKKELEYNDKLKDQENDFLLQIKKKDEQIQQLSEQFESLKSKKQTTENTLVKTHQEELEKNKRKFNEQIHAALAKNKELESEIKRLEKDNKQALQSNLEKKETEIQNLTIQWEQERREIAAKKEKWKKRFREKTREVEETEKLTSERDQYIGIALKQKYETKLIEKDNQYSVEQQKVQQLQAFTVELQNRHNELKKQKEFLEEELNKKIKQIENEEKEKRALIKEKEQSRQLIKEKQNAVTELKAQNQELEKLKFVLDYKISILTDQIKPNKDEIEKLRNQLKDIENELERAKLVKKKLTAEIKSLELKNQAQQNELKKLKTRINENDRFKETIRSELHETVQMIQDPKLLKEHVKRLYHKYVTTSINAQNSGVEENVKDELEREKKHLEDTVKNLKKRLSKASDSTKSENMRIMNENILLINEINVLRKNNRDLLARLKEKDDMKMSKQLGGIVSASNNKLGFPSSKKESNDRSRLASSEKLPELD